MSNRIRVGKDVLREHMLEHSEYSEEDALLVQRLWALEARDDFWAYRRFMDPQLKRGWFVRHASRRLQRFYKRMVAGERPVLVITAPPQHGKSRIATDFVSWLAGKAPAAKTLYGSYSDRLGRRANLTLQRIMDTDRYKLVFPETSLAQYKLHNAAQSQQLGRPQRNLYHLEWVGQQGSFQNTTVGGQVTGMGLDFGLLDDPIKGRLEAMSKKVRDNVWDWLTDDFFTRFSENAGLLLVVTRWHIDDPVGRFKERFPEVEVLRYPAIATKDSRYRDKGEALFPEHKSLDFLLQRKRAMTQASWESLYQQNPIVVGGGIFPVEQFTIVGQMPSRDQIKRTVRYWDKAGSQDKGAYTCGVRMHELQSGRVIISDVVRGQWSYSQREARIKQVADLDSQMFGLNIEIHVEQEPGSGGKESAERTIQNLRGYSAYADRVTGDKETRAEPYAAQVQVGNVDLLRGPWNQDFVDEHETFPTGKYKDQVDAAAGAFSKLIITGSSYDDSYGWVE